MKRFSIERERLLSMRLNLVGFLDQIGDVIKSKLCIDLAMKKKKLWVCLEFKKS